MLKRMARDVVTFVLLIGIFLLAYGVAAQALLWPQRELDAQTFENVLFRPYFQIYGTSSKQPSSDPPQSTSFAGELFLEDINAESDCVGQDMFSSCGHTVRGSLSRTNRTLYYAPVPLVRLAHSTSFGMLRADHKHRAHQLVE